jgi:AAA15 family ATPase/GTPase
MVTIESISIYGFKAHSETEIPANNINIITGKNNVGKTSVLEAIDLAFRPTKIRRHGKNADTVINFKSNMAEISCQVNGSAGQPDLFDYTNTSKEYSTTIKRTSDGEKLNIFRELISKTINNISLNYLNETGQRESINTYKKVLSSVTREIISEKNAENKLNRYFEAIVVIEQEGLTTPYIYLSEEYSELVDEISSTTVSQLESRHNFDQETLDELSWAISREMGGLVIGRYGKSNFIGQLHDHEGVKFVRSLDITKKNIGSVDNYSVILSKIEDDLRKYNIIEDLYDFSLDNLVFEDESGRYQLPYDSMGDGFKSITGLLWELKTTDRDNQIILLEEPENHMHPGYIQKLVEFIVEVAREEDIQFFITTHNVDLIDEFLGITRTKTENYLSDNFQVVQMRKHASQIMDLEEARTQFEDLHLDLRGE